MFPPHWAVRLPGLAPSLPMVSSASFGTFRPAQLAPLFRLFSLPAARVKLSFAPLFTAKAQLFSLLLTSIFTPSRVMLAVTPLITTILSAVEVVESVFLMVSTAPVLTVRVLSA